MLSKSPQPSQALTPSRRYDDYFKLFQRIFRPSRGTDVHYLPGNYDIPLGNPGNIFEQPTKARARFTERFGPLHSVVNITGHNLVLLDSIGLVEEDYRRYGAEVNFEEYNGDDSSVIEFIKRIQNGTSRTTLRHSTDAVSDPLPSPIVFSHIPLSRPESARCGPLREGREDTKIRKGVGLGYQNLLGRQTSHFIVDAIDPVVVFSGDDHDYCDMVHADTGVREVTVKSFSPSTGVSRPGFQLLSLVPPEGNMTTYADVPCILPDQTHVYWWVYLPLAVVTCAWVFLTNARQAWARSGVDVKSKGSHYGTSDEKKSHGLSSWGSSARLHSRHQGLSGCGPSSPLLSPRPTPSDDPEQGYDISPMGSRQSSHLDLTDSSFIRRTSSGASLLPGGGQLSASTRRNVLPRIKSATDWASEARAKDKPVLSLMLDPGAKRSRARAFGRWLWRSRRSVLVRTWTEALTLFAPAVLVWVILNALFFL